LTAFFNSRLVRKLSSWLFWTGHQQIFCSRKWLVNTIRAKSWIRKWWNYWCRFWRCSWGCFMCV